MGLAALQLAADLHDEDGAVLLGKGVFPLLGRQAGVQILQLLAGHEGDLAAQAGVQVRELPFQLVQRGADGVHDVLHRVLQKFRGAVLGGDHLFPVPLVHVDGVQIIHLLIPADGVHVGYKAVAHPEAVLMQGQPLPLGQAVNHLGAGAGGGHVEADRALHAVQVVVQAGGRVHEQGRGDPLQMQCGAELHLEDLLDQADGLLGVVKAQAGRVAAGQHGLVHWCYSSSGLGSMRTSRLRMRLSSTFSTVTCRFWNTKCSPGSGMCSRHSRAQPATLE